MTFRQLQSIKSLQKCVCDMVKTHSVSLNSCPKGLVNMLLLSLPDLFSCVNSMAFTYFWHFKCFLSTTFKVFCVCYHGCLTTMFFEILAGKPYHGQAIPWPAVFHKLPNCKKSRMKINSSYPCKQSSLSSIILVVNK